MVEGVITRHYFKCPNCLGWASLETHICRDCGSSVMKILWSNPVVQLTPELVMIGRSYYL